MPRPSATCFDDLLAPDPETGEEPLNEAQLRAARAASRPQLVLAGPGTGKTRLLTYRAAYVLLENEPRLEPADVVVITFTTKAAAQLRRRLTTLLGPDGQYVRAGTIHHFCYELVREHADRLGLPEHFIVADDDVTDAFWQPWCERNGHGGKHRKVKLQVSRAKLGLEAVTGAVVRGMREYEEALLRRGALDFDDLLVYARDLLRDHEDVRRAVQQQTGALLVDEFQDTDPVQYRVIRWAMCPERQGLFCVADDDQSIFGFRGADPSNVRRYIDDYGCCREEETLHVLNQNYRSNHSIFRCAESVLDPADRLKHDGEVQVAREKDAPVILSACRDEAAERAFVRAVVEQWIGEGVPRSEIALLTPWNKSNEQYEDDFLRAGIPCEASGGARWMDTPLLRKLRALLRLVARNLGGQGAGGETEALLGELLSQRTLGTVKAYARDRQEGRLRLALHDLALRPEAREWDGLSEAEWEELDAAYSLITNVLSQARSPGMTVGELVARVLPQLEGPLRLLAQQQSVLTDPRSLASMDRATAALEAWCEAGEGRLVIHHEDRRSEQLWALMVRHALFPGTPHSERIATLRGLLRAQGRAFSQQDLVVTLAPEAFAREVRRAGLLRADARPGHVLEMAPEGRRELPLDGAAAVRIAVDEEGRYESPSVRLFKLLQAASSAPPRPLYDSYVMVDLETTGLDVVHCRVAEIGALLVEDGEVTGRFCELVRLEDLTPSEEKTLREVCGIDPEELSAARPGLEVWRDFCAFAGARPLVAHNGQRFDFRVLDRLRKEHREHVEARWTLMHDMLPDARRLFPELPSHSAEALRRALLDETEATAHRALADCEDQQRLLEALQAARAEQERKAALEPLLAAVALCLPAEQETRLQDASGEEALLLRTGYVWTLKGGHAVVEDVQALLPSRTSAADLLRTSRLGEHLEDVPFELAGSLPLDVEERMEALVSPYADEPVEGGLAGLLAHVALWGHEGNKRPGDVVTISTYHSAKGLEFERVICAMLRDGALPAYYVETDAERREQRRLLYVGMTRAMTHLMLTYPRRGRYGEERLSPFLGRLPREHHVTHEAR